MTYAPSSAAEEREATLEDVEPLHAAEPPPLLFWQAAVLAVVLSAVAWALVAACVFALYRLFAT